MAEGKKIVRIEVDEDLWREVRLLAVGADKTVSEVAQEAFGDYVIRIKTT